MYKLIAIDMDGTLLNNDKKISKRTFNTIQDAKSQGIKVVLASGRPLQGLTPHLQHLGLTDDNDFVISYNGSIVQRVGSGEIIHQTSLLGGDAKLLQQVSDDLNVFIHAFSPEKGLITHKVNEWTEIESNINAMPVTQTDFQQLECDESLVKIMMVAEPSVLDKAILNLPASLKEKYTVVRSAPFFLEFLHPQSNKGVGVSRLADILGIDAEQVICVGDAENDHHMMKFAGLAVAMENADEETKALADYITLSNEQDGVAVAIEKFALA